MIKKIKVAQLRPGMFVHDFACGWLANPFFKSRLLIKDSAMLEKVVGHGIKELFIDTAKGADVDSDDAPGDGVIAEMPDEIRTPGPIAITLGAFDQRIAGIGPEELRDELPEALKLRGAMEAALEGLFSDVSAGRDMDISPMAALSEKMVESTFRNESALPCVAKLRQTKKYLVSRALNVNALMIGFAKHLGMPPGEIRDIAVGSLLHDIGMLRVDQALLNKPQKLAPEEYERVKMHVLHSYEIIFKAAGDNQAALHMALLHHERYDGSGYSQGIKGERIPQAVRMLSVADTFDAMTTERVYNGAMNLSAANRVLLEMAALERLDEILVHRFIRYVGIYPVGTVVRLSSGKVGVVIKQNADSLLKPVVKIVYDERKAAFVKPRDLDLSDETAGEKVASSGALGALGVNPIEYLLA